MSYKQRTEISETCDFREKSKEVEEVHLLNRCSLVSSALTHCCQLVQTLLKPSKLRKLFPRPYFWNLLTFPLRNKDKIHKNIFTLPKPEADQKKATKTCTHHSISLDSRSFRSSCTFLPQRSWYSVFARLYRTQERPLAVVSWSEEHAERLGSLAYFSTRVWTNPHLKAHGRLGRGGADPAHTSSSHGWGRDLHLFSCSYTLGPSPST